MSRGSLYTALLALVLFVAAIDCEKLKQKEKRDKHAEKHQGRKRLLVVLDQCESNEFKCSEGTCISTEEVCDTFPDCNDGSDEENCPTDCTGPHQFKCESSDKCVGLSDRCDGHRDCTDYSDEAFCDNFECAVGRFKCVTSHECLEPFFDCDGVIDCQDGSDERNCYNGTCRSDEWQCAAKDDCIHADYVCDGDKDCLDHSDEIGCTCTGDEFHCNDGGCIPGNYKCDGDNDCGDRSDELICPALPADVCMDVLTYADCFHMNETTHPICLIYDDGNKFCRKYCGFCTD
ncbi:hypothetical protein BsWGS_05826 [Bradybaena similaris]